MNKNINTMIVINTEYVKKHYPNASKDPNHPTGIDHNSQFMICNSERGIVSGQGTADLNFRANVGDYVSFQGISITGNSDDAVIIYGIKHWSGDGVFNRFITDQVTRSKAVSPNPDSESDNGLPALVGSQNFISYEAKVRRSGVENFYVYFALYTLADDGNTQELLGYYYWDPTITVQ